MSKEVVEVDEEYLRLNPDSFVPEQMGLDDFQKKLQEYPSLGFNAFQRLYSSLRMFGVSEHKKHWNIPRWNFLDYRVRVGGRRTFGGIYGHEKAANTFMEHLEYAIRNPESQGKAILLYGPTATSKSNFVEILSDTLDAFATFPQGEIYSVRFNVKEFTKQFGGLSSINCPAHETPLNFLGFEESEQLIDDINAKKPLWQHVHANHTRCPSCSWTINTLKENGVTDFRKNIEVIKLNPFSDVQRYELRVQNLKSFNSPELFGGQINMGRLARFDSNRHPLVVDFGRIGGTIDGFSSQRHLTSFSEMYKNPEDTKFLESLLDVVYNQNIKPTGFEVALDTVFIGTTNLNEYESARTNPSFAEYLQRRIEPIEMSSILIIDDLAKALKMRVFKDGDSMHVPPQFIKSLISTMGVLAALDAPESDLKIDLLQKAKIYNGEIPHGVEKQLEPLLEELIRFSHDKPFGQRTEGILYAVPFSFYGDLPKAFKKEIKIFPSDLKSELADERFSDGCVGLLPLQRSLESIVRRYDGVNDDTRARILDEALILAFSEYKKQTAADVRKAVLGEETIKSLAVAYLAQAYSDYTGNKSFKTLKGLEERIDEQFLKDVEKYSGVSNSKEFRSSLANNILYRKNHYGGQINNDMFRRLATDLLSENPTFRRALEGYAQITMMPATKSDITVTYSDSNSGLMKSLYAAGYCKTCASAALGIQRETRGLVTR